MQKAIFEVKQLKVRGKMVQNAKYEEFGHETNSISFQMIFATCSKWEILAARLLIIQELKEPNAS